MSQLTTKQLQLLEHLDSYINSRYDDGMAELVHEQVFDFIFETMLFDDQRDSLNESIESGLLVEYTVADSPLSLIEDSVLLEKLSHDFFGDDEKQTHKTDKRDYKKDKNGKRIVGMNKETTKRSGTERERRNAAAHAYYGRPGKSEEQNARMRAYRRKKAREADQKVADARNKEQGTEHWDAATVAARRKEDKKRERKLKGRSESPIQKAERIQKAVDTRAKKAADKKAEKEASKGVMSTSKNDSKSLKDELAGWIKSRKK